MLRITTALAAALSITGCATTYNPDSMFSGLDEAMLAKDTFRITSKGNAFTSGSRAQDYALLRAAELSQSAGCTHFTILDQQDTERRSTYMSPATAYTNASVSTYGNTAYGSATTTYSGGMVNTISKPVSSLIVKCFTGESAGIQSFDAAWLEKSLKEKYKVKN